MGNRITLEHLISRAIKEKLTLEIDYTKQNNAKSHRIISEIIPNEEYGSGYISAYCHMSNAQRTFKIPRIADARIVLKIRPVSDNYVYDASKPIYNLYEEEF